VCFPFDGDACLPLSHISRALSRTRNTRDFFAYGRLADGVSLAQARSELSAISEQLGSDYPNTNKGVTAVVRPYREGLVGADWRLLLWSLMGAVGCVLLIACANVANLLLARAADRSREIAIRASIGATRSQVVRQLLIESVILAFVSGVAGLALAHYGVRWFDAAMQQLGRPYWITFTMDANVFVFFAAVCLATALLF